ncbi:uncharacterized protein FIESC28_09736 [Fusarium coffeatum]|uniref:Glycoside hydrolase family 5 domain-containing protein n=1 Tax=Fusarium coffeatum TaxID=231269 RepID=A0A366QY01_9HYPO|nr:uncharacterized protein FIESC28_09736 [Fusarium coffeatum]RBR09779.1 hypothetical protein FIESC28_09736 [Fusarium coffeatum]
MDDTRDHLLRGWTDVEQAGSIDGENEQRDEIKHSRRITKPVRHVHFANDGKPYGNAKTPSRTRTRNCSCLSNPSSMILLAATMLFLGVGYVYQWKVETALHRSWIPDAASVRFGDKPLPPPPEHLQITNYTLPLRTQGRDIVDIRGRRFKMASVNWYGASDEFFVTGGLDIQHRDDIAKTIKKLGFNSVRLPYADELVIENPIVDEKHLRANSDLIGLKALDIFHAIVETLTKAGIAVIVNNHVTSATWCCGANPCDAGWSNDHLGPICRVKQTEEEWIQHWEAIMLPHIKNPLVIGVDLRNEVRGLWGTMPWSKWAPAAERCGNRLLQMNKDWLVIVEGTESSNDLSSVCKRPILLDTPHTLVYSAHVYAWSGWGSWEGRFLQRDYKSFAKTMRHNWAYILEKQIAPVWVGEIGAPVQPSVGDINYWQHLTRFLQEMDADFGYWALNARKPKGNATERYGLLQDDWKTPVLDYRMKDMLELMAA